MLRQLTIRNLGLIEAADLEFSTGLQVITGETGVGKSMLLDSLALLRGERARADRIRRGADSARVSGFFVLEDPDLRAQVQEITGLDLDEGELWVERRLRASGRHPARINGQEFPLSVVGQVGQLVFEVQSQRSIPAILEATEQREMLDRFGKLTGDITKFREVYREARALADRIDALRHAGQARNDRRIFLEHVAAELESAELVAGEREGIECDLELLEERDRIQGEVRDALARLYEGDGSARDALVDAQNALGPVSSLHASLRDFASAAEEARVALEEAASALRSVQEELAIEDPGRLDQLRGRLDLWMRLEERYQRRGDGLITYQAEVDAELAQLADGEEALPGLEVELRERLATLGNLARAITTRRRRAAKRLATAVANELTDLGMEQSRFEVRVDALDGGWHGWNDAGGDEVTYLFGPNPGEPAKTLKSSASGGELSRVMLSLKRVLAKVDRVPILIFDEIDAGVGGRLGTELGRKLRDIAGTNSPRNQPISGSHVSGNHQVFCVTHLPQIASFASCQFRVAKSVSDGRTTTNVERLQDEGRVEEIAAMIRGAGRTETSLAEAREMISEANG